MSESGFELEIMGLVSRSYDRWAKRGYEGIDILSNFKYMRRYVGIVKSQIRHPLIPTDHHFRTDPVCLVQEVIVVIVEQRTL